MYSIAVVGSRDYRERNIRARIEAGKSSETDEEVQTRLNLGDAHVVLLVLMAQQSFHGLIDPEFEEAVEKYISACKYIKKFSDSDNVLRILDRVVNSEIKAVDEVFVRGEDNHLPFGESFEGSSLQQKLHDFFENSMK